MRIIIRRQNILIIYSTCSLKREGLAPKRLVRTITDVPTATAALGLEVTQCVFCGSVAKPK